jgi:Cu+-exporting ATPase
MENNLRDPVCGMNANPQSAKEKGNYVQYQGADYYFCSAGCKAKFEAEPQKYIHAEHMTAATHDHNHHESGPHIPAKTAATDIIYTCPMHPEVRQVGPGHCPICGMALEPLDPAAARDSGEYRNMLRRFIFSLALAIPVFVLAMLGETGRIDMLVSPFARDWIEAILSLPVVLWAAWPFYVRGLKGAITGHANMFTLITMGVAVAFCYSAFALLYPAAIPIAYRGASGVPQVYFEAAAAIVALVLLGQVLELRARASTGKAVRALLDLSPKTVHRRIGNTIEEAPLSDVQVGDELVVRPGDSVPTDGEVIDGESAIDESMITGESIPVTKAIGNTVTGGTLNGDGALVIRAAKIGADTMLSKIVSLVAEAQRSRAPMQSLADKVSAWFVPAVVLSAMAAFVIWFIFAHAFDYALLAAIAVLIVACPCALGLATPMSVMVSVGKGAQSGVLVRNATSLERLAKADTLVIDKTGTVTEGKPKLAAVRVIFGNNEDDVLALAAALESKSAHPLAHAIVEGAKDKSLALPDVSDFTSVTGQGLQGSIDGAIVLIGRAEFLQSRGIDVSPLVADADKLRTEGATVMFVARAGKAAGLVAAKDPLKANAKTLLHQLRHSGLTIIMATGDAESTAKAVARDAGLENVAAGMTPESKTALVNRLKHEGHVVAFAGDGVNDAPALAAADVSIAMGTGSDAAIETAGLTLLKGDLSALLRARRLARAALRNMKQNLFFAFIYNSVGIPVAAGILYPFTGWLLSPMLAAAAMSLSSVSVITNSLRLRFVRL